MGRKSSINAYEIVDYILNNNITLREYSRTYNIPLGTLYYHIKNYCGDRKQELSEFLAKNQETSRKMCGTYHWKSKREKNI